MCARIIYGIQCHKGLEEIKTIIALLELSENDKVIIHVTKSQKSCTKN